MAVKTAYLSRLGRDHKISPHFTLGEFASKDGADKVLYSTELLAKLEELRAYGGFTIVVNSGYRTASYNRKIGGASRSQHVAGTAADISVRKDGAVVDAKLICCLCQSLGFKGVAYISPRSLHVDMRSYGSYRGDERKGYSGNVGNDFYSYFDVTKDMVDALKLKTEETKEENKKEESEEEEMVYKDITEIPEYYRESVQLRIDHGWTDGKNITESMCRIWTVYDRENPYIVNVDDVPVWAKREVQELIDSGKIKGNGVEQIGKRWQVLESVIIGNR